MIILGGLWSDGTTLWVSQQVYPLNRDNRVYAYNVATKNRDPDKEFGPSILNIQWTQRPAGFWSDGTTLWVMDSLFGGKLYAYNLANKNRDPAKDFDGLQEAGNRNPRGIWSDGTTIWVADSLKLYAYNLANKNRDPAKDFDGLQEAGNHNPRGIWSDGTTIWVADSLKLYAYNLANRSRDPANDIDDLPPAGISYPWGIWSDGTTMWVADSGIYGNLDKLYAFNLASKNRDPAKDVDTLDAAGNNRPQGLWSDGTTLWVADSDDNRLYAYRLPGRPRSFTGPTIVIGETAVAAVHFMELRGRINALRVQFGLPAFPWTDPTIMPGVTPVKAVHINELRMALSQAYGAAGRTAPGYTDVIRAGATPLKAVHVNELRRWVVALE